MLRLLSNVEEGEIAPSQVYGFIFNEVRGARQAELQLSEVELYDTNDQKINVVEAWNPGGIAAHENEDAMKAIDGDVGTKWIDKNITQPGGSHYSLLMLYLSAATTIKRYDFFTANDRNKRDPISWTFCLEREEDGEKYLQPLHEMALFVPPFERFTSYTNGTGFRWQFPPPPTPPIPPPPPPISPPHPPGTGLHYAFIFTQVRGDVDELQLSEVELYDTYDQKINVVEAWNPGGIAGQESEEAMSAFDGNVDTKWVDTNITRPGRVRESRLLLLLPRATPISRYDFFTANNPWKLDPISWAFCSVHTGGFTDDEEEGEIIGSAYGFGYKVLHEVSMFEPPWGRKSSYTLGAGFRFQHPPPILPPARPPPPPAAPPPPPWPPGTEDTYAFIFTGLRGGPPYELQLSEVELYDLYDQKISVVEAWNPGGVEPNPAEDAEAQ